MSNTFNGISLNNLLHYIQSLVNTITLAIIQIKKGNRSLMDYLYLLIYKIFALLVHLTPDQFFKALANTLYKLSKKYQKVIDTNLNFAFANISQEEKERIGKRTYLNFLHTISGFIKRQGKSQEEILKGITFQNDKALQEAVKNGDKIILITAHYGNWELLPVAISAKYQIPLSVVGKSLKSPIMQKILKENREQLGIELIDKRGAMRGMMKAFSKQRAIGLLVDHHTTTNEGAIVEFFGKEVTQTLSAAMLAKKYNATIFPVFIRSKDFQHHTLHFETAIKPQNSLSSKADIQRMTQAQADVIEKAIKEKPDEWFWLHRRWKYCCRDAYLN